MPPASMWFYCMLFGQFLIKKLVVWGAHNSLEVVGICCNHFGDFFFSSPVLDPVGHFVYRLHLLEPFEHLFVLLCHPLHLSLALQLIQAAVRSKSIVDNTVTLSLGSSQFFNDLGAWGRG